MYVPIVLRIFSMKIMSYALFGSLTENAFYSLMLNGHSQNLQ